MFGGLALPLVTGNAPVARAADEKPTVTWTAKVDPAKIAPGGEGALVLTGVIRAHVHVFADGKKFKVLPTKADGVTWARHSTTKATKWVDPLFPDDPPSDVWFDKVEVRVPFTLAADAKLPLHVSATIKWNCCDEETCYNEQTTKPPLGADVLPPDAEPQAPGMAEAPVVQAPVVQAPVETPVEAPAAAPAPSPVPADPLPSDPAPAPPPVALASTEAAPTEPAPAEPALVEPPPVAGAPLPPAAPTTLASRAIETPEAKISVTATSAAFVVVFEPAAGHHLYPLGSEEGIPVSVDGKPAAGVTWGKATAPPLGVPDVHEAYTVTIPYTDASDGKAALAVAVAWQACLDTGTCRQPEAPHRFELRRAAGGHVTLEETMDGVPAAPAAVAGPPPSVIADAAAGARPPAGAVAARGLLFPVEGQVQLSLVQEMWRDWGLMILGWLVLVGIGLAFTPCVLPIIPITVSIVGGGKTDVTKGRLTFLLTCYVAGLCTAFGTLGLLAAQAGASFSAAFQSPVALWIIAGIFVALAFGMFGVYELQPPQWAQRLQGGAKGGNPIGAFVFGGISAVIASPCTGPVIAGLIVLVAQLGSALLGFVMFACLGLGMGIVFFAAGSLNLLMRPGPWMVWVRYVFGLLLVGAALYYLRSANKISPNVLFGMGLGISVLAAVGIWKHLVAKEGEESGAARRRGSLVGGLTVGMTLLVAFLTGSFAGSSALAGGADEHLSWPTVKTRAHLVAEVEAAQAKGRVTVVDAWGEECFYCKKFDEVIEENPDILAAFLKMHRLRLDLPREEEDPIRDGLGIPYEIRPFMVFIDAEGRIRRSLDVESFGKTGKPGAAALLRERVKALYGEPAKEQAKE